MNNAPSRLPPEFTVRPLSAGDITEVLALSDAVSLQASGNLHDGFLVSGYPEKVYRDALTHASSAGQALRALMFGAYDLDGGLAGFVFGYNAAYGRAFMDGKTETAIDGYLGLAADYYILKQIAIAAQWRRRGVGQALADAFLSAATSESDVFLTIVTEPANPASERFHAQLGFHPVLDSVSRGAGGDTYPSRIWRRESRQPRENP